MFFLWFSITNLIRGHFAQVMLRSSIAALVLKAPSVQMGTSGSMCNSVPVQPPPAPQKNHTPQFLLLIPLPKAAPQSLWTLMLCTPQHRVHLMCSALCAAQSLLYPILHTSDMLCTPFYTHPSPSVGPFVLGPAQCVP